LHNGLIRTFVKYGKFKKRVGVNIC
jgi:hypothetical protein